MRRTLPFIAAAAMLFAPLAQGATVSLPDVSAEVGDEVSVTVYVDNPSGVLGYFFDITYQSSILQFVGIQNGGLALGWSNLQHNPNTPGRLIVTNVSETALASGPGGGLVEIRFKVKGGASGTSPLHFTDAELNDGTISASADDGSVKVGDTAKLGVPPLYFCPPNGTIELPILIQGPATANGLFVEIAYDTDVLSYVSSAKADVLDSSWQFFPFHNDGRILIAASGDTANLPPSTTAATITFMAQPGASLGDTSPILVEIAEHDDDGSKTLPTTGIVKIGNQRQNVWVDFGWSGEQTGSSVEPVNDLWAAQSLTLPDSHQNFPSNIKIKGSVAQTYYPGPVHLDAPAKITANNGAITIGATPTKSTSMKSALRKLLSK